MNDISSVLRLITNVSAMTAEDYIKKSCGSLLFLYYTYVDNLHRKPVDLIDLVDGLLYIDAKNYIIKQKRSNSEQGQLA